MLLPSLSINKWVVTSCFRYEVFTGRILLAALDHNFHVFRKTLEGRFKKIYSKRSGNWRVEPVKESKQYPHVSAPGRHLKTLQWRHRSCYQTHWSFPRKSCPSGSNNSHEKGPFDWGAGQSQIITISNGKEITIGAKELCISKNAIFEITLKWCVEKETRLHVLL